MKTRKPFATIAQREAWQAECRREATKRMIRQLMRQLKPAFSDQHRLAQEYRDARAAHIKAQRERKQCAALGLDYDAISQGIKDFFNDKQVPA